MLRVEIKKIGDEIDLTLGGKIDENANLDQHIKVAPQKLNVFTKDVQRLNSIGITLWCRFFKDLRRSGTQLSFFELSPLLVEQMNFMSGFIEAKEVASVCVPFECVNCSTETVVVYSTSELRSLPSLKLKTNCQKCSNEFFFEDADYLRFLK
jgi:anti-anti-sigma regulatory factor